MLENVFVLFLLFMRQILFQAHHIHVYGTRQKECNKHAAAALENAVPCAPHFDGRAAVCLVKHRNPRIAVPIIIIVDLCAPYVVAEIKFLVFWVLALTSS